MIDIRLWCGRAALAAILLGPVLMGPWLVSARGQDEKPAAETTARDEVVAGLKAACESDAGLKGVLLQGGDLKDGTLRLVGTIDRTEQRGLLEAAAGRLIGEAPARKGLMPSGATAADMAVFPVRTEWLPKLQHDLAESADDPSGRTGMLRQTRLDDLYFDRDGRLRVVGLCVNQVAFLARKNAGANPADDPLSRIAQAIRDRLLGYPLPANVAPTVIGAVLADGIKFAENPARWLQRAARPSEQLQDVLFVDSRFDAEGALVIDGLLGSETQRAAAAALVAQPEFSQIYGRPANTPAAAPEAVVAAMVAFPWRLPLLEGLQKRFSSDSNRDTPLADLRYCRIDRAEFLYTDEGLLLRFEGVALLGTDEPTSAKLVTALHDEALHLFQPPRPVEYNAQEHLTRFPNPRRNLQVKVASLPALDGVRVDDVAFNDRGETSIEGVWVGPAQTAALKAALVPLLSELNEDGRHGALAFRLEGLATDRLLREVRRKVGESFDETSFDRLLFQPATNPDEPAVLTLQGATLKPRRGQVEAALDDWLKTSSLVKTVGTPTLNLATRPRSLVDVVRRLVVKDTALDGVRVDRGIFDEDNALALSGLESYKGQAERLDPVVARAAAMAWPNLPAPADVRAVGFTTIPLRPLLDRLARMLPYYTEADGVMLDRAYYDPDSALVLGGHSTGNPTPRPELIRLIKLLLAVDPLLVIRLDLVTEPRDPQLVSHLLGRALDGVTGSYVCELSLEELDRAIFHDPTDSTLWYLRAAYYLNRGDVELAMRDAWRVKRLEYYSSNQARDRGRLLTRFQGPLRARLDELEAMMSLGR